MVMEDEFDGTMEETMSGRSLQNSQAAPPKTQGRAWRLASVMLCLMLAAWLGDAGAERRGERLGEALVQQPESCVSCAEAASDQPGWQQFGQPVLPKSANIASNTNQTWFATFKKILDYAMPKATAAVVPKVTLTLSKSVAQVGEIIAVRTDVIGLTASQVKSIGLTSVREELLFPPATQGVTNLSWPLVVPPIFKPIEFFVVVGYEIDGKQDFLLSDKQKLTVQFDPERISGIVFDPYDPVGNIGFFSYAVGYGQQVEVWAHYPDGRYADITSHPSLTYEIQDLSGRPTSSFSISSDGYLTMNQLDEGRLIVRLGKFSLVAKIIGITGPTINGQPIIPPPLDPDETPPPLNPTPPVSVPAVILDNPQGSAQGNWYAGWESGGIQYQGNNYQMHDPVVGGVGQSDWFRWRLPQGGTFDIYASWQAKDNRARNAVYSLVQGSQITQLRMVDQRQTASDQPGWQLLGRMNVNAGDYVQVAPSSTGKVVADAIKLVRQPTTTPGPVVGELLVDDAQASLAGSWYVGYESSDVQYVVTNPMD